MTKNSSKLPSFTQIPGYMFFLGHFKIPIDITPEYLKFFKFKKSSGASKTQSIKLRIDGKDYEADIRKSIPKKSSETILFRYNKKPKTLKALRKFMISSYAETINKSKPKSKEQIIERIEKTNQIQLTDEQKNKIKERKKPHIKFTYIGKIKGIDTFKLEAINRIESEFDDMLKFLEEKDFFAPWKAKIGVAKQKNHLFLRPSLKWIPKKDIKLPEYKRPNHIIYLLNHSDTNRLYVGQTSDSFAERVSKRHPHWNHFNRFLIFELAPEYGFLLDDIEDYSIKLFATIFVNKIKQPKIEGLNQVQKITLENLQVKYMRRD